MWLLAVALVLLAAFGATPAGAAAKVDCPAHYPNGEPEIAGTQNTTKLCRLAYAVRHDDRRKEPLWVAYELTRTEAYGCFERKDRFKPDPDLKAGKRAELADYKAGSATYDRGHVAPADDMLESIPIMRESFYLSNMTPQIVTLNRGLWARIEQAVHIWAADRDGLAIVTGPIFAAGAAKSIGSDKVAVPSGYYKVAYDSAANIAVSFEVPNQDTAGRKPEEFVSTLGAIEKATGIALLPGLGAATRAKLHDLGADELWPVDVKHFRSERLKFCRVKTRNGWRSADDPVQ